MCRRSIYRQGCFASTHYLVASSSIPLWTSVSPFTVASKHMCFRYLTFDVHGVVVVLCVCVCVYVCFSFVVSCGVVLPLCFETHLAHARTRRPMNAGSVKIRWGLHEQGTNMPWGRPRVGMERGKKGERSCP